MGNFNTRNLYGYVVVSRLFRFVCLRCVSSWVFFSIIPIVFRRWPQVLLRRVHVLYRTRERTCSARVSETFMYAVIISIVVSHTPSPRGKATNLGNLSKKHNNPTHGAEGQDRRCYIFFVEDSIASAVRSVPSAGPLSHPCLFTVCAHRGRDVPLCTRGGRAASFFSAPVVVVISQRSSVVVFRSGN